MDNQSPLRLVAATGLAFAGLWGFFLAAAAYVFQPAQVGPDHGGAGAIAGIVCLVLSLVVAGPSPDRA